MNLARGFGVAIPDAHERDKIQVTLGHILKQNISMLSLPRTAKFIWTGLSSVACLDLA